MTWQHRLRLDQIRITAQHKSMDRTTSEESFELLENTSAEEDTPQISVRIMFHCVGHPPLPSPI